MSGAPWVWPPPTPDNSVITSSDVVNESGVVGGTVTDALDTLDAELLAQQALIAGFSAGLAAVGTYPYIRTPLTPNAFDDEFPDGSNPDLAARGYTVVTSAGVTLTRAGNIDPWGTAPAGNTYFSQIINSWLFLQAAPGVQIDFYKTVSLAAGDTYFCRMAGVYNLATNANGRFCEFGLYGASGAALDGNNRVFNTVRDDTGASIFEIFDVARVTAGATAGATGKTALGGHDIRGVHFVSGTDYDSFLLNSQNGEPHSIRVTGAPASATLTRVGLRNLFSTAGSVVPQIWAIDFIRKKTANAWLIP